ncbi:hypothetical protein QCN37_gp42 [Arthrobacter phage Tatanka]|uniref:Uncharacterized protein n=1 Tax=Arthrobacter phage Tatanka TaxID=2250368 RepID=A0A2Z5HGK6_9CAUD|nr:hypothetical protein QCN37_gp42 [Arthrobacter phage Tatanka]AXC38668.1 hypothetical protein SEA_TATANKA_42 [Arthrobacter phage Tatanka]
MTVCAYCGVDRDKDQLRVEQVKFQPPISVCKDERFCKVPNTRNDGRNYEFRTIPDVDNDVTVSRDGEVRINGKDVYDMRRNPIRKHDGTKISIQMAIHLAFPDIPLRYTPTE